jgi:hypothetical protein
MNIDAIYAWCILAGFVPFLATVVILVHYGLWRVHLLRTKQSGRKRSRLHSYCLALGMAFLQIMRVFYEPSVAYLLEAKQDEDVDEDDQGDPETVTKQLNRQLKRIRRGELVERLVLRL